LGRSPRLVAHALFVALLLLIVGAASPASASSPYLVMPSDEVRQSSPAYRHANLSDEEAYAELERRGVPFTKAGPTKGVRAPVRLNGPLHGVHVHSSLPLEKRATTMFEILDARLALSLDDFCALLERHDIVELVHYTMYRPNGPKPGLEHAAGKRKGKRSRARKTTKKSRKRKSLGKGSKKPKRRKQVRSKATKKKSSKTTKKKKAARKKTTKKKRSATKTKRKGRRKGKAVSRKRSSKKRARRGKKRAVKKSSYAPPGTRHPAGLAIDVGGLRKRDGRWLSVAHHFHGRIGARTCGPNTSPPKTPLARELWSIVCEAADLGLFTYVLTPNYDAPHADHFHMEIRGDVRWFLYH
jgi:hypothetical protein